MMQWLQTCKANLQGDSVEMSTPTILGCGGHADHPGDSQLFWGGAQRRGRAQGGCGEGEHIPPLEWVELTFSASRGQNLERVWGELAGVGGEEEPGKSLCQAEWCCQATTESHCSGHRCCLLARARGSAEGT